LSPYFELGNDFRRAVHIDVGDDPARAERGRSIAPARPIPDPPPTTGATRPSSLNMSR